MLFNKNDNKPNERILYTAKPNMILGCKKAIYGLILLVVVLFVSPIIIKLIGKMQVYLITYVKLSLTRYTAIGFFVIILIIVVYIIWQLVAWHSIEYTLTDSRVIIKSGVLSTKKSYMPYATIQDVNTSQNIIAKLFNVGSVSIFSAYDNNLMELSNISNPSKVEEIIFSNIAGYRSFQPQYQRFNQIPNQPRNLFDDDYYEDDYHDEFEPITPITHERYSNQRRDYEYYPENLSFDEKPNHTYEYEPYGNTYTEGANRYSDRHQSNRYPQASYYDEVRDEYSYDDEGYHDSEPYYNDGLDDFSKEDEESPQNAIKRHFDKFKK